MRPGTRPGKEHVPTVPTHVAMFLATQDTPKATCGAACLQDLGFDHGGSST